MSELSEYYASYMTHFHKFSPRMATFKEAFNVINDLIHSGQFIDCKLENQKDDYPKYPCIFNYFNKTINFDVWKIYNAATDNTDLLLDYITDKDALNLRSSLDTIPTDLVKLKNDVCLQYTFWSDYNDLFDTKLHFYDYSKMKDVLNYYNSLDNDPYNTDFKDQNMSFTHIFLFDFLFRLQLKNMTDFPTKLNTYCIRNNIFNKTEIKDQFSTFVNSEKNSFFPLVIKIILQSLYTMTQIDSTVTTKISNSIINKYSTKLINAFNSYVDNHLTYPITQLNQYILNSLYLVFGSNKISDLFNNTDIFNLGFVQSNSTAETLIFKSFKDKVTTTAIKNYLYILYLYKSWPIKFLNVSNMIISEYVEEQIKPASSLAYSQKSLESLLSFSLADNNINYSLLADHFNTNVTTDYILQLTQNENVIDFGFFLYFVKTFDNFMESDEYSSFVSDLYEDVFVILRDGGHVDHLFNWDSCQILFDLFFKTFIRTQVVDGKIFSDSKTNYSNVYQTILQNQTGDSSYDVSISFQKERLKSLYGNLVTSHFDNIHYFIESIYLSSLTYSINFDMLNYFLK